MQSVFTGPVYVVRDNIDTDQIISAQHLNLVPTIPEEYEKLGSYALDGLPKSLYPTRYVHRIGFRQVPGCPGRKFRPDLLPQLRGDGRALSV